MFVGKVAGGIIYIPRYTIEYAYVDKRGARTGKGMWVRSLMKNTPFTVSGPRLSLGVGG